MSTKKHLKISDLNPSIKGDFSLVFEVHEVIELKSTDNIQTVKCRVVDETGIVTALFDQYASKFVVGSVFEIQNFRCRVVEHHLILEMIKTTVVSKQPFKMGFKDLENDLSAKFYVTAKKQPQNEKVQAKQEWKKQEEETKKNEEKAKKNEEKEKKAQKEENGKHPKDKKQKEQGKPVKNQQRKQSQQANGGKKEEAKEQRKEKKYVKKQETTSKSQKQQQPTKHVQKYKKEQPQRQRRKEQTNPQPKKLKFVPKCKQIKLSESPQYQQEQSTFIVRVNLQTAIRKEKYLLCKVSDLSGSTYFEFQLETADKLQDKAWYRLIAFRVYQDRDYGFIATEQKHSSIEILPDWQEKFDTKLLWR